MAGEPGQRAGGMCRRRPTDVVVDLVNGVCARRDDLDRLYSEPTRVTHPLAGDEVLETRAELREHFARAHEALGDIEMSVAGLAVHEMVDPEWVVAEFSYVVGRARYGVPCVFVVRVAEGLIVESRDYMDLVMFGRAIAAARQC